MRNLAILITTVVTVAPIAQSVAAPCRVPGNPNELKWETPLSLDEIYKSHPSGEVSTWKFTKQRYYYGRLYKDTPEDACKLWAKLESPTSGWKPAQRNLTKVFNTNDPTTTICAFDCFPNDGLHHGDGMIDGDDVDHCGIQIDALTALQTDEICDRDTDVQGLYKDGTTGPTTDSGFIRGENFTTSQKNAFKAANEARTPDPTRLKSDAYGVSVATCTGEIDLHADYEFLKAMAGSASSVQVDHLVPRKDVFGCGCGTNSPRNAALVSQKLNNAMSNDPNNQTRLALLCRYAPNMAFCPPPPPKPCPLTGSITSDGDVDGDDLDDDDVDGDGVAVDHVEDVQPVKPEAAAAPAQGDEIGGCSAGGATGGASALALIGFVGFVRRRGTSRRRR